MVPDDKNPAPNFAPRRVQRQRTGHNMTITEALSTIGLILIGLPVACAIAALALFNFFSVVS